VTLAKYLKASRNKQHKGGNTINLTDRLGRKQVPGLRTGLNIPASVPSWCWAVGRLFGGAGGGQESKQGDGKGKAIKTP